MGGWEGEGREVGQGEWRWLFGLIKWDVHSVGKIITLSSRNDSVEPRDQNCCL